MTAATSFTVRPRTPEDVPGSVAALSVLYKMENYPLGAGRDLHEFITNKKNQSAWVAVSSTGKIVGHVSTTTVYADKCQDIYLELHPGASIGLLSRLYVLPEWRKFGVADELMHAATAASDEDGRRLVLSVMTPSVGAIKLYDRLGWERFATANYSFPDGSESDAICFASPRKQANGTD